jgi:hypothetical protein
MNVIADIENFLLIRYRATAVSSDFIIQDIRTWKEKHKNAESKFISKDSFILHNEEIALKLTAILHFALPLHSSM